MYPHLMVGWHVVFSTGCGTASVSLGNYGWVLSAPGLCCSHSQPLPSPCFPFCSRTFWLPSCSPSELFIFTACSFFKMDFNVLESGPRSFQLDYRSQLCWAECSPTSSVMCSLSCVPAGVRILAEHPSCFHVRFIVALAGRWRSHLRKK